MLSNACWYTNNKYYKVWWSQFVYKAIERWQKFWKAMPIFLLIQWCYWMAQQNQGEVEWPQYAAQCLFVHWGQIVQRMVVPIHLQGNWKVIEFLKRRYQNICQSNVATEWPRKIRDRSNSYDMLLNTCFYYKDKWYKVWRSQSVYKAIESWQNFWKAMPIFLSIQWRHQAAKKNQRKVACPQYAAKCLFVHWGQIVQSMIVPIRLQGDQKLTEFFEKQCQYFCQSNGAIKWSSKIRERSNDHNMLSNACLYIEDK